MFKKYRFIKWTLTILAVMITTLIILFIWIINLLPQEDKNLMNSHITDLEYITENVPPHRGKILAIVTSTDTMGTSEKSTGYELTELARAYYVFKANGFEVDIASPLGGKPPVVIDDEDMGVYDYAFLNDSIANYKITNSLLLEDVISEEYNAVYFVGGKGAMFDFPNNKYIQSIIKDFHRNNKVIGAVCHGPSALVNVTLDNGQSYVKNKQISSFTNEEELLLIPKAESIFPFLLQDKLIEEGANFNEGIMYLEKISHDENLITGQNPWSVWALSEAMVKQLDYTPKHREVTSEENAVQVLYAYETKGLKQSKELINEIIQNKKQSIARALIIDHSFISIVKGDIKKFYEIVSLASFIKDTVLNK